MKYTHLVRAATVALGSRHQHTASSSLFKLNSLFALFLMAGYPLVPLLQGPQVATGRRHSLSTCIRQAGGRFEILSWHGKLSRSSRQLRRLRIAAFSAPALEPHADGTTRYTLILYTKKDCPLCEGLQQKLEAVIERAQFLPSVLSHARWVVPQGPENLRWATDVPPLLC